MYSQLPFHQLSRNVLSLCTPIYLPKRRTFRDLIDNLLCSGAVEVVHDDISTPRCEQQGVTRGEQCMESNTNLGNTGCAYAFPSPPPAPVTTTV